MDVKKVSIADFVSRWDYSKASSHWHFDRTLNEDASPPFKILGWIDEDFTSLIDYALKHNSPINFGNRLAQDGKIPYTKALDDADLNKFGYGEKHILFHRSKPEGIVSPGVCDLIRKIQLLFAFKGGRWSIHIQYPGQTFPLHIDNLTSLRENREDHQIDVNPNLVGRVEIQLTPWDWGHVWGYGNTFWKQWRNGEIAFHHWQDIPHYTANSGQTPRVTLQMTGTLTDKTRKIIDTPSPILYKLS